MSERRKWSVEGAAAVSNGPGPSAREKLPTHRGRRPGQGAELAEGPGPAEVLHAAVGRRQKPAWRYVLEGRADPRRDRVHVLDPALVREIQHADDELLSRDRSEDVEVDVLLCRLQRYLVDTRL